MTDTPAVDVSVVIPCYNHGEFIREAIRSAEASRGPRFEVIVVDDGSTDALTLDVMAGLRRDGYRVLHQANLGLSAARNAGIAHARGRYILPLDADNRIRPDYLRLGVALLDHAPRVGVVYGDVEYFGEAAERRVVPDFSLQRLLLGNFVDACAVFRRAVWEECGGYDTEMPDRLGYEDWEFWLQVAKRGWEFARVGEVVLEYRVRADSMLQRCGVPENHSRLTRYLATKHRDLYTAYLPEIVAAKDLALLGEQRERVRCREELAGVGTQLEGARREVGRLRAELAGLRARLSAAETGLAEAQGALQHERVELAGARAELTDLRRTREAAVAQLGHLAARCRELQDAIVQMKASLFWQARGAYVRLRRLVDPGWS